MAEVYYIKSTNCPEPKPRKLKNGNIVYDIVFRIISFDGITHQKRLSGFKTKTLAKQAHADFITKHCEIMPKNFQLKKSGIIFEDAFALYFQYILSYQKESSCYSRKNTFDLHITPHFKGRHLDSLTKQDFYEWQDLLLIKVNPKTKKPYSRSHISKTRGYLSAFLSWVDERYDIPNMLSRIKLPASIIKKSTAKKPFDFWEDKEFYKFIDSVDDILYKSLFSFLYFTGCRKGEAIAATESDYNGKTFHINKTYTNKTLDGSTYKITPNKQSKDFHVLIVQELHNQMDIYLQWKREHKISDKFLFGGDSPIPPETLRRKFNYFIDKAKIRRIWVHELRHSCASLLIHHGASLQAVADWLGDRVEQVLKTYGHLYVSDKVKLCESIKRD